MVYRAELADEVFEKSVFVKLLPLGLVTAAVRARFERARRTLPRLDELLPLRNEPTA